MPSILRKEAVNNITQIECKDLFERYLHAIGLGSNVDRVTVFLQKLIDENLPISMPISNQNLGSFYLKCCILAISESLSGKFKSLLDSKSDQILDQIADCGDDLIWFHHQMIDLSPLLPSNLINQHQSLIRKAAATYHQQSKFDDEARFQDLLSVGWEALFLSAKKYFFFPKGNFNNFAWKNIKEAIRREQNHRHPVPVKIRKKLGRLADVREEFFQKDIPATYDNICQRLSISFEQLEELLRVEKIWGTGQEFETGVLIEDIEQEDLSPSALSILLQKNDQIRIKKVLSKLTHNQAELIKAVFFEGSSMRSYAEQKSIPFNSVKKQYKKALHVLKEALQAVEKTG